MSGRSSIAIKRTLAKDDSNTPNTLQIKAASEGPGNARGDRIPNEILIEVVSNLDMADLLSISQTHRSWRQILTSAPRLWTKLIVKSKVKRPSHHQLIKLFKHILMAAERSHHSLEHVVFRVHSPGHWDRQVCHVLQLSAATLKHIELYAPNQPDVYEMLYRFCPLLRKLIFLYRAEVSAPVSLITAQMLPVKGLPPVTLRELELFHLEEFHAIDIDDSQMDKHLDKVRVLKKFNPFRWHVEAGALHFDDERLVRSITEHLEHWQLPCLELQDPPPDYPPLLLRLSKLRSLLDLELHSEELAGYTVLRISCPNLLEMRVSMYDGLVKLAANLAQTLKTTTQLQRLTFEDSHLYPTDDVVLEAMQVLPDLRYLKFDMDLHDQWAERLLLPCAVPGSRVDDELMLPLPRLDTLLIRGCSYTAIRDLTRSLVVRELLRTGFSLTEAYMMAFNQMESLAMRSLDGAHRDVSGRRIKG
ncbi:hypothetical protein PHSY_002121 [Pseudozyma hubeiensis SY62]|uniref:F-box domain-containing protein n=1 Tax=Pseudozyma hubeiensis (strain SY62) TaxID=1305764 RepID=R9P0D2_PSEHS|nr:hypothetical protein PHSY_002121 [Pseudozyma hubeiensis SY62]GAC94549.1 hypothetical protein PHSY_002121 [Pseudozyma hubeiensis SY62]